jgi:hypothetical protein
MTLECEHGQLARSCNICYLEREIAGHEAVMRQALEALENAEDQLAKPYSTGACCAITALRERLGEKV